MYTASRIVLTEKIHREEYAMADRNARYSKQLYNAALFRMRQVFTGWEKASRTENEEEVFRELAVLMEAYPSVRVRRVLSYRALEKLMRVTGNPDFFAGLPMQTAQAVVKAAVQDFRNWLAALRKYRAEPSKFTGKPRMPRYCKGDRKTFTITNQDAVLYPLYKECGAEEGRAYAGMELKLPGVRRRLPQPQLPEDASLKEVKVCPYYGKYVLMLVFESSEPPEQAGKHEKAGIDFGTDNIAAIVTTDHGSRVYKGGAVLAENRLFAKERAKAAGILARGKGNTDRHVSSRHIEYLSRRHDAYIRDMLHKVSRDIIRYCEEHGVGTIVIGTNRLWKQRAGMGAANNQKFVSVPYEKLRRMITYKAEAAGIRVLLQEESYTSKADVTSGDRMPVYGKEAGEEVRFSGRRTCRGLYRCGDGSVINADCNGAANILRKAFPDAWEGTEDYGFLAKPEGISFRTLNRSRAVA